MLVFQRNSVSIGKSLLDWTNRRDGQLEKAGGKLTDASDLTSSPQSLSNSLRTADSGHLWSIVDFTQKIMIHNNSVV